MSKYNETTIDMYNKGGALEYIEQSRLEPEPEKWEKLLNYINKMLSNDYSKRIIELGSGCGELTFLLQKNWHVLTLERIKK